MLTIIYYVSYFRYLPYALGGGYILTYPAVQLIVDKAHVLRYRIRYLIN